MKLAAFKPSHVENRMRGEGDVVQARADYAQRRSTNLERLLRSRFEWMNEYIGPNAIGVDVGCGAGFSANFIRARRLFLTDFAPQPFLDVSGVDALQMPFRSGSLDFVVASNMIHHLPVPLAFLDEAHRVLRPGGFLLMHEVHASLLMCLVLRAMRHEGYSFEVDVFDRKAICTDPDDLWAGNNAIPSLLFEDHAAFAAVQPGWEIVRDETCECLMFLNSGGVTAKTAYVPLPLPLVKVVESADRMLTRLAPNVLALGRRIALRRT